MVMVNSYKSLIINKYDTGHIKKYSVWVDAETKRNSDG